MPAKFVLKQTSNKGFRWNLVATNGRVIATSERYETRRAAMNGIESTRKNAPTAEVVEAQRPGSGGRGTKGKTRTTHKMLHKERGASGGDSDSSAGAAGDGASGHVKKMLHGIR